LVTGSGEVFTTSRSPPLTRWLTSATPPPVAASTACSTEDASPASSIPSTAPAVGRIAVEIASHSESR
jgi:hypothetical protein